MDDQLAAASESHWIAGSDLQQWRLQAIHAAQSASIPVWEVDWLLRELTDLETLSLRLETFGQRAAIPMRCSRADLDRLWCQRLTQRLPLQQLTGSVQWRQMMLRVSRAVLIPRPETELIVELAMAATESQAIRQGAWADLGTGSGAIALGLAQELPQIQLHAVDCSAAALGIARQNAQQLALADRIQFYQGSWFEPLQPLAGQLAAMIANPPYIPSGMIPTLQPEVALHEPMLALDGGSDGLDSIRQLVITAPQYLQPGGLWLVEVMAGQAQRVGQLLEATHHYDRIQIHRDFAGIDRFVQAFHRYSNC